MVFQMTTTAMFLTTMSAMECTTVPMEEMRASVVCLSLIYTKIDNFVHVLCSWSMILTHDCNDLVTSIQL